MTEAYSFRSYRRYLALFLLASGCSSQEPAPETSAPAATPASSETVNLHGEWDRWIDTARFREAALAELSHVPELGIGRQATSEEIAAIDIDVMPDGTGLPEGRGTVARGKELYDKQCVQCHGADGRGGDFEAVVGREPRDAFPFAESLEHVVTVGNYWPYATTLFDYVRRAMPQAVPGSLPADDVYSLVAYVLYLNEIVSEDAVLDVDTLPQIVMPARDRFVYDDREGGPELK